ncbi:MAG: PAS domain S-box protein [bacterium]|nr:PAS domain S-box protein [bacterium]MDZ4245346.1 PAS domain S-box protein [Candidatus Gracilibacteria bacterium]
MQEYTQPNHGIESVITDEKTFSAVYRFLIQYTDNPIWICDKDGKTIFVNEHFNKLTGYTLQDMTEKPSLDFYEENYHSTIIEERKRRQKGLISSFTAKFKAKNGIILVKITVYPLPNGGGIGILQDLSSQTNTDADMFKILIENMDEGVWVGDENDNCKYANPSFCAMVGYPLEEIIGVSSADIIPEKWRDTVSTEVKKRGHGKISTYTIELITKSNETIPVRVTGNPLPNKGGNMAIITDIRNEKRENAIYKTLIDNMNEAVFLRDENGELEFANQHFCQLVGYGLEELIGDREYKYWADESLEKVRNEQKKRNSGISSVYRATIKTKDRERIPVLVSASPTIDGGNFGILTDLRDLLSKEYMFQSLVENMNEGIWMGDIHGNTTYINNEFCSLTGYSETEALNKSAFDFWSTQLVEGIQSLHSFNSQKSTHAYEVTITTKNGEAIPVILSTASSYDGGIICLITDIRELKRKEKELSSRDHYLATVTENSVDGIISIDLDYNILSWNKGAEKIFGFTKEEVLGQTTSVYISKDKIDSGEIDQITKEVARKGSIKDFRTQRKHKDGHLVDVSLTQSPTQDEHDKHTGYSMIYRDISLQKKWEEELNLRFDNLKNAYVELGKKGRHMDYFVDLLDSIIGDIDVNSITDFIIGAVAMITKVDACTLRYYDKDRDSLVLEATNGVTAEWYNKGDIPYAAGLTERAFLTRKPLKVLDLHQEPLYKAQKLAMKHNLNSMLVIPLYIKDELLGSLTLYISKESKFGLLDNDFIENFAKLASIALKIRGMQRT